MLPCAFIDRTEKSNPCLFSAPIIYKSEIHRLMRRPLKILLFPISILSFHVITSYPYNFLPTTCSRHKLAFAFPDCNIMLFHFVLPYGVPDLHKVKQNVLLIPTSSNDNDCNDVVIQLSFTLIPTKSPDVTPWQGVKL